MTSEETEKRAGCAAQSRAPGGTARVGDPWPLAFPHRKGLCCLDNQPQTFQKNSHLKKTAALESKSLFLLCLMSRPPLSVSDEMITRIIVEKRQSCDSAVSREASAVGRDRQLARSQKLGSRKV